MNKVKLYLIVLALNVALIGDNQAQAAKLEACMTQTCIDYFNEWKKLSYRKYNTAISALGEFYYEGYGTEKDLDKSLKYFKNAAKYKYPYAQYRTAMFYLLEEDYLDKDKGIKYLKKAARQGHSESAFLLAVTYGTGELTEKDTQESDKWLDKAIKGGHSKAQRYANYLHSQGDITYNDYPKVTTMIALLSDYSAPSTDTDKTAPIVASNAIQWPQDSDIEVIEVHSPSVEEIFDFALAFLRVNPPASRGTTGTRIVGKTCLDRFSCGIMDDFFLQGLGGSIVNPHAKIPPGFVR